LFIEAIIGDPRTGEEFGGATLVELFKNKQVLRASRKSSTRFGDTTHSITNGQTPCGDD
jgi:hypothetical protein